MNRGGGKKKQQEDDSKYIDRGNQLIVTWFEKLIKQIKFRWDNATDGEERLTSSFRLNSLSKSLDIIKKYDKKINKGSDLDHFRGKGIGQGTIDRIDEILTKGKLVEVNEHEIGGLETGKYLEHIEELEGVFGIGRKKAFELYTKNRISSVQELKNAYDTGEIDLPDNIVKGLKYYGKIRTKIPRSEIDLIYSYLIIRSLSVDSEMDVRVCGSYRRGKDIMGDVDVIISHPSVQTLEQSKESKLLKMFVNALAGDKFIVDFLTSPDVPTKFMGICRFDNLLQRSQKEPESRAEINYVESKYPLRRIDIRSVPQESYYTAILYFTGSKNFNKKMRMVAKDMGYLLNEYSLTDEKGKQFKINSEKDVFDLLNMEYIDPSGRND